MHDALFTTCRFSTANTADINAFANPQGGTKPGSTTQTLSSRETNVPGAGATGLSKGWEALIYSIQIKIGMGEALTLTNLRDIYLKTLFDFIIGIKSFSTRPVYDFAAAGGAWGVSNVTNAESWNNGVPSPRDKAAFIIPHHLFEGVPYKGKFTFEAALAFTTTTGYDVEVHLEGLIKRPVS